MPFDYRTIHLSGQQKAIIEQRKKNDELIRKSSQEKVVEQYKLSEEQLNFLARLNLTGVQHYDVFGDSVGDKEAKKLLSEMHIEGYLIYSGGDATITDKGKEVVKDRTTYRN